MKTFTAGGRAGELRAQRLATVRDIVTLANERGVDALIVAGDQFEDRAPANGDIASLGMALAEARMPVIVLPGDHDPVRADSPFRSSSWKSLAGPRVTTVMTPQTIEISGGVVLAAPCDAKCGAHDPTAAFEAMPSANDCIRVGVANGKLGLANSERIAAGERRGGFRIALDAASRSGLAYLALGLRHSFFKHPDAGATIAYSGTPEQTAYDDADCRTVSIVTIAGPRARPEIERVRVGRYAWAAPVFCLSDGVSVARAVGELRAWPDPLRTLMRPSFRGFPNPEGARLLAASAADLSNRFFVYDQRTVFEERPESARPGLGRFLPGAPGETAPRALAN
jgi:hypothetical protein